MDENDYDSKSISPIKNPKLKFERYADPKLVNTPALLESNIKAMPTTSCITSPIVKKDKPTAFSKPQYKNHTNAETVSNVTIINVTNINKNNTSEQNVKTNKNSNVGINTESLEKVENHQYPNGTVYTGIFYGT